MVIPHAKHTKTKRKHTSAMQRCLFCNITVLIYVYTRMARWMGGWATGVAAEKTICQKGTTVKAWFAWRNGINVSSQDGWMLQGYYDVCVCVCVRLRENQRSFPAAPAAPAAPVRNYSCESSSESS